MPIYNEYTMHMSRPLDLDLMSRGAQYIVGEHDFKAFCSVGTGVKTTVREIYSINVTKDNNDIISIEVPGNGFLYKMVRIIVGTLVSVAAGRISSDEIPDIIASRDRSRAGMTAPADGLYLNKVIY